jgi:hypothetical protein
MIYFERSFQLMIEIRSILFCLLLVSVLSARAADTNSLVWQKATDRVSADIHGEALWPLLEDIAHQTGWHIFVEPSASRSATTKFKDLPPDDALRMLLGTLNFALMPQTNGPDFLYVFTTRMENATRAVVAATNAPPRRVANELLVKVKPGTDIEALARALGANITGRNDKLGIYRLQFDNADSTSAALATLKGNSNVAAVDYNYIYDAPPTPQPLPNAPVGPVSLTLNPPPESGGVIIGLVDTALQSSGTAADKLLLKQISIAGEAEVNGNQITHGESMLETLAQGLAAQGPVSARVVAADIYGNDQTATTWNLILGLQAVANNGANFINLSLGGNMDSPMLDDFVNQLLAKGIVIFAATGNNGANTVNYPAADTGVIAVAATQGGKLAPYSNYGVGTVIALPGQSVVYLGGQAFVVQGTSPATAFATGVAAGSKSNTSLTLAQILSTMRNQFAVPQK